MNKGPLCVLACYILWGLLPGFWRLLDALDPLYLLAVRILWALIFTAALLAVMGKLSAVAAVFRDRRELLRLCAASVLICINWGVFIWAVNSGHILDSSLAYYMNPILTVLIGTLVFRERLTRLQWLSVAITALGLVIAMLRFGRFPWAAVVIGGSFALYGTVKKGVSVDAATSLLMETLIAAPPALAVALWGGLHGGGALSVLEGGQWLLLPLAGVVTSVPLLFFAYGIRRTPMTLAGIIMYVNPTLQLLTGVIFFHEEFTATYGILFGFVWAGLALYLLSSWLEHQKHKEEAPPCA